MVGLGNPGRRYAGTRHNIGFEVAERAASHWGLARGRRLYAGVYAEGRAGAGGPRVGVLLPHTYMNEVGRSAGPARGATGVPLARVVAVHDEIDLPFGEVRTRLGGGLAGHNGLKSLERGLGGADFHRVRMGVGRPESTDPEVVSAYVLARFRETAAEVAALVERGVEALDRLVRGEAPG